MTTTIREKPFSLAKSRRVIQWLVVIGTFVLGLRHIMPGETSRGGSFDSFCAFGGIETLLPFLFTGHLLKSTNLLNFSVLIATLGVSLIAGRAFCGWLCGLGAIQDFVAEWTRKLLGERRHIRGKQSKTILPLHLPAVVDRSLRYAKYLVLAVILIASLYAAFPPLREFCPVRAVFGLKMTSLLWFTLIVFLAQFWWNVSGASIFVRSARRWPSSTRSRPCGLSLIPITATVADAVTSNVRWASKMYLSTWMTPNVSAVWNVWTPVHGMGRWN